MGCADIHDFIAGTTIAVAALGGKQQKRQALDIVRPNLGATELVARHVERLETLSARSDQAMAVQ